MTSVLTKEIEKLKRMLLALSAVVEESLQKGVRALETRDNELAQQVIREDIKIDEMEVELEEEGLKILALHQPVAIDLRFIVAVLRINSDLERIGDLAVNLAERASFLSSREQYRELPEVSVDLTKMAEKAKEMVRQSLDALVNLDPGLAREVLEADNIVDAMNREMFQLIYDRIRETPDRVEGLIHLLSATRHLERVADHATNIAEDVIYMITGEIVRHQAEDFTR
ncbi:MAG: phosphate signaling complex protein PhoU [bacterium]